MVNAIEDARIDASVRRNAAHGGSLVVTARRDVAVDVVEFTFARPDGERLPDWAPGAHIDLVLPDGTTRQYSLVGDRWDAHHFTIAVLRERDGRGGSERIHTELNVGDVSGSAAHATTSASRPPPATCSSPGASASPPLCR